MSAVLSGFVGAVVEAWDELRVHKTRVLLALVGVAVAVTAITTVTAAVGMLREAMQEQTDRGSGRDATLSVYAWAIAGETHGEAVKTAVDQAVARFGITYYSPTAYVDLAVPHSGAIFNATAVSAAYGIINRVQVTDGRWFTDADAERYAPTLVVNQPFLDAFAPGVPLAQHPQVTLKRSTSSDEGTVTAEVIGIMPNAYKDEDPRAYVLFDEATRWFPATTANISDFRLWVPPAQADALVPALNRSLTSALPGYSWQIDPPYDGNFGLEGGTRWVVLGVGGFALLLGGLGLLNIALVTVRYRIREIGVRRSFGATGSRVFFGVLMESVVATTVAGFIGVVASVAIIKCIPVEEIFGSAIQDVPPFPLSAALVGMACAVGIGALSGLIPATYAVRVKVIDAIRY